MLIDWFLERLVRERDFEGGLLQVRTGAGTGTGVGAGAGTLVDDDIDGITLRGD